MVGVCERQEQLLDRKKGGKVSLMLVAIAILSEDLASRSVARQAQVAAADQQPATAAIGK